MHGCFSTGRKWLLLPASLLAAGCFDVSQTDPHVDGVLIEPDKGGWVVNEELDIHGAWYVYGDRYGDSTCLAGGHPIEDCSEIFDPVPEQPGFPNENGRLCTGGQTAVVPRCAVEPCTDPTGRDFENVWGAGIGLDLNAESDPAASSGGSGSPATHKSPWEPLEHGVVGVSFEIDSIQKGDDLVLRVEFPIVLPEGSEHPTTESHPKGSPYWGATGAYVKSPVKQGFNRFRFTDVKSPVKDYTFESKHILAIQFHVPSVGDDSSPHSYSFCIDKLTFLRE
jgi:hypothetical protein